MDSPYNRKQDQTFYLIILLHLPPSTHTSVVSIHLLVFPTFQIFWSATHSIKYKSSFTETFEIQGDGSRNSTSYRISGGRWGSGGAQCCRNKLDIHCEVQNKPLALWSSWTSCRKNWMSVPLHLEGALHLNFLTDQYIIV